jgi:hypothetical protein
MTQIVKLNKFTYYRKDAEEVRMLCVTRAIPFIVISFSSLLISVGLAPAPSAWADASDASALAGEIVVVQGKVMIRSEKDGPGSGVSRVAEAGGAVYPDDVVNTSSESKIKILLKDKSIIDLGPSSLFKVDHFDGAQGTTGRKVDLSMAYGTMRTAVTQKLTGTGRFKVHTPSATMGVRGTEFVVQSDLQPDNKSQNTTQVTVLQGAVAVASHEPTSAAGNTSGAVVLTPGMQMQTNNFALSGQSGSSTPKTLDTSQMTALSSSTKIADLTFQKAVTIDPNQSSSSQNRDPASSGSGSGSSTDNSISHSVITTTVALPPPPPVTPAALGVPGAFAPNTAITQTPVNPLGTPTRLHVVIVTQ